jgi:DNA-binding HxlR family transcriptional regulator
MVTSRNGGKGEPGFLTVQRGGKTVCPASKFQKMVRGKYKLRILWGLQDGWRRYSEIKKGLLTGSVDSLEIAPRVLTRELKTFLAMGMVERRDHRVFPLKVEYRLTRKGRTFLPVIAVIHKWGLRDLV